VLNKCDVDGVCVCVPGGLGARRADAQLTESGLIAFEEFFRVLQTESLPEEMPLEQLAGAFAVFDPENTGFVSAAVFRSVLELKGEPLNQEDIDALMKECEINGDGQISIRAFIDHMVATSRPTPPPLRYAPVE
jgi:calmodulin